MRRIVLGFWIVWSTACAPQTTAPEATPQAEDAPAAPQSAAAPTAPAAPQGAATEGQPASPGTIAEATPPSSASIAEVPSTPNAPTEAAPTAPPADRPAPPPTHAPTTRPTPPPRPGPRPSAPRPSGLGACETSADCVVHCAKAPGCCPDAPCGCRNAIRKDKVAEYDAWFASSCTPAPACPAVGCAWDEAFGATCREGRCVATDGPL